MSAHDGSDFEQPPTKRQRVEQRDRLAELADVLFAHICSYLSLEFKCLSLPMLSKAFKAAFRPDMCCRGNVEAKFKSVNGNLFPSHRGLRPSSSIDRQSHQLYIVARSLSISPYLQHASNVKCTMCDLSSVDQCIVDQVVSVFTSCLNNPFLKQLKIDEHLDNPPKARLIDPLFSHMSTMSPYQLRNLHTIELWWNLDPFSLMETLEQNNPPPVIDWSGLSVCQSLQTLKLKGLLFLTTGDRNLSAGGYL